VLRPLADGLEQFALLLLDVFLTLVAALLRRLLAGGALPPLAASAAEPPLGRLGFGGRGACAGVPELRHACALARHPVKIVLPREDNMLLVFRESRAVFAFDRACDLAALVLHVVVNEDVALFGEDGHRLVLRRIAGGRRRLLRFFFQKFAQTAAVA